MTSNPAKIFISYSHDDKKYLNELKAHLSPLERSDRITFWCDQEIAPGKKWADEIRERLNNADIVLLLVSAAFIDSNYCYDVEFQSAEQRCENNETTIIPIIIRDCVWQDSPLKDYEVLPDNAKPVRSWTDRDKAYVNVVQGIDRALGNPQSVSRPAPATMKRTRTGDAVTAGEVAKTAEQKQPTQPRKLSPAAYRNKCGKIIIDILSSQPEVEGLYLYPDIEEIEQNEAAKALNIPDEEGIVAVFASTCWWNLHPSNYYIAFGDSTLFLENGRREALRISYSDFPQRAFAKTADGQLELGSGDTAFLRDKVFNPDYLLKVLLLLKKAFDDADIASRKPDNM